jgi:hypothetical protein
LGFSNCHQRNVVSSDVESAPRGLEILIGVVVIAGAAAVGRFGLLGVPDVLLGQGNAAESVAWRTVATATSGIGLMVGARLLAGRSGRPDGHLFGPVALYAGAVAFVAAAVLGVIAGILIEPVFFAHSATLAGLGLGAWRLAVARAKPIEQARREV